MWFPFVSLPFNFNSIFCTPANNANSTPCHLRTHFSSLLRRHRRRCWVQRAARAFACRIQNSLQRLPAWAFLAPLKGFDEETPPRTFPLELPLRMESLPLFSGWVWRLLTHHLRAKLHLWKKTFVQKCSFAKQVAFEHQLWKVVSSLKSLVSAAQENM